LHHRGRAVLHFQAANCRNFRQEHSLSRAVVERGWHGRNLTRSCDHRCCAEVHRHNRGAELEGCRRARTTAAPRRRRCGRDQVRDLHRDSSRTLARQRQVRRQDRLPPSLALTRPSRPNQNPTGATPCTSSQSTSPPGRTTKTGLRRKVCDGGWRASYILRGSNVGILGMRGRDPG
jgi:hypothetical protein